MKVKELIKLLKEEEQNTKVYVAYSSNACCSALSDEIQKDEDGGNIIYILDEESKESFYNPKSNYKVIGYHQKGN